MLSSLNFKALKLLLVVFFTFVFCLFTTTSVSAQASLLFDPSQRTVNKGELFDLFINIDTNGEKVGGTGARITYDPAYINVISIIPGSVFEDYPSASFDNSTGQVVISGISASIDKLFSGTGLYAQLKVLPVSAGSSQIKFEFQPGSTTDSNIAVTYEPWDILGKVNTFDVTIKETGKTLEVTPPVNSNITGKTQQTPVEKEQGFFGKLLSWFNFFPKKETDQASEVDPYAPIERQEPNSDPNINLNPAVVNNSQTLDFTTLSYITLAIFAVTMLTLLFGFIKKRFKKQDTDEPPTIINGI
jgi:hypothetical protein